MINIIIGSAIGTFLCFGVCGAVVMFMSFLRKRMILRKMKGAFRDGRTRADS